VDPCAWSDVWTYGSGVNPTNLCLEFCETHEQDYFIIALVAHFSCNELRCIRSGGDVGFDIAQRFELPFSFLSAFHGTREY